MTYFGGDTEVDLKPFWGGLVLGAPGVSVGLVQSGVSLMTGAITFSQVGRWCRQLPVFDLTTDHSQRNTSITHYIQPHTPHQRWVDRSENRTEKWTWVKIPWPNYPKFQRPNTTKLRFATRQTRVTHSLVDHRRWRLATADDHSIVFLLHCSLSCDISFSWI